MGKTKNRKTQKIERYKQGKDAKNTLWILSPEWREWAIKAWEGTKNFYYKYRLFFDIVIIVVVVPLIIFIVVTALFSLFGMLLVLFIYLGVVKFVLFDLWKQ